MTGGGWAELREARSHVTPQECTALHTSSLWHEVDALLCAVQEGLWEEAELLHARELEMTAGDPAGPPEAQPRLPRVDVADIEAVISAWTGIDVQRLGQDEQSRLLQLASVLEVRGRCLLCFPRHASWKLHPSGGVA